MKWVEALKLWNGKKGGTWCIPRKGSEEYNEVREIMKRDSPALYEARNVVAREKAIEKLRGVEAATKARNEERKKKAPEAVAFKFPAKASENAFLKKALQKDDSDKLYLENFEKEINAALKKGPSKDKSYGVPLYDLKEFYSRRWPKNANNTNVPESVNEEFFKPYGLELIILETEDGDAYGRWMDVIFALLKRGEPKIKKAPEGFTREQEIEAIKSVGHFLNKYGDSPFYYPKHGDYSAESKVPYEWRANYKGLETREPNYWKEWLPIIGKRVKNPAKGHQSSFLITKDSKTLFVSGYKQIEQPKVLNATTREKLLEDITKQVSVFGRSIMSDAGASKMEVVSTSGSGRRHAMKGGITLAQIKEALDSNATKWISAIASGVPVSAAIMGITGDWTSALGVGATAAGIGFILGAIIRRAVRRGSIDPETARRAMERIQMMDNPMARDRSRVRDLVSTTVEPAQPPSETVGVEMPTGEIALGVRGRGRRAMKGGNWLRDTATGQALMMMAAPVASALAAGIPVGVALRGAFDNMGNARGAEVLLAMGASAVGGVVGGLIQEAVRRHMISRAEAREARENLEEQMEEGAFEMANPMRRVAQNPAVSASPDVTVSVPPPMILQNPDGTLMVMEPVEGSGMSGGRAMLARLAKSDPFLAKAFHGMHGGAGSDDEEEKKASAPGGSPVKKAAVRRTVEDAEGERMEAVAQRLAAMDERQMDEVVEGYGNFRNYLTDFEGFTQEQASAILERARYLKEHS